MPVTPCFPSAFTPTLSQVFVFPAPPTAQSILSLDLEDISLAMGQHPFIQVGTLKGSLN